MSPPISRTNSWQERGSTVDGGVRDSSAIAPDPPALQVLLNIELLESILDHMEEAEIQNSLLWVSKALVPTIMARTCRVMAWDAVVAAQRSNFWMSCGLDAVRTVVYTIDDEAKLKEISSAEVDSLFVKCPSLRQVRADHRRDKAYSRATEERVWTVDRESGRRTVKIHERGPALVSQVSSSDTAQSFDPPNTMTGWDVIRTWHLDIRGGPAASSRQLVQASRHFDRLVTSVCVSDIRASLEDLAQIVTARQRLAGEDKGIQSISHIEADRVERYDIHQFVSFAESVGPTIKVLHIRDWNREATFPPAWGMSRPGVTLLDLGDMVDAIHDRMTSFRAFSFVIGGSVDNTSRLIQDADIRLSTRDYLRSGRTLQTIDMTFSETFGGDPLTVYRGLPLIGIARNLACIADAQTRVTLRCVTSQGPARVLLESTKLVMRLIRYFRRLHPNQLAQMRFVEMKHLDICANAPERLFDLTYDTEGTPVPLSTQKAFDSLRTASKTLEYARSQTLSAMKDAEHARSSMSGAEEVLRRRQCPYGIPKWPFDDEWRDVVGSYIDKPVNSQLELLRKEKATLTAEVDGLQRERSERQAEVTALWEEVDRLEREKQRLIDGLRVFR